MTSETGQKNPMKTLTVLSPSPTFPVNFGHRKRIRSVCEAFQIRGFEITFLFYPFDDDWRDNYSKAALQEMRSQWDEVELIIPSIPFHPSAIGADHAIDEWWDPAIASHLEWHFRSRSVDVFLVNYAYLSKALEFAPASCFKLLDTHDRLGGRRQVLESLGVAPEFFHTTVEDEAIALGRADAVIALKDEENTYFSGLSERPVFTLPYFQPTDAAAPKPAPEDTGAGIEIGIIGARNSVNHGNISAFLDIALPMFREYMAPIKVVLAGGMCADFDDHAQNPYVELMGQVEHVKEFYDRLDAVIVPMQMSTGQKIKVGEALSTGLPVFSHAHAFEGYKSSSRFHRYTSFSEMAEELMKISFSPDGLQEVRDASVDAYTQQQDYFEGSADALAAFISTQSPRSLFMLDANELARNRILEANILSTLSIVSSQTQIITFISGPVETLSPEFVQQVSARSRIVSTDARNMGHPNISYTPEFSDVLSEFDVKAAWLYGASDLGAICDAAIPAFLWPGIGPSIACDEPEVQCSGNARLKLLTGYLERAGDVYKLRGVSELDLMPFDANMLRKLRLNKRAIREKSCAVFVSQELFDWGRRVFDLVEAEGFQCQVFATKDDLSILRKMLPEHRHAMLTEIETVGEDRGLGTQGAFSKIIDLSIDPKTRLFMELCVTQQSMATGQIAFWRFPQTSTYRPLQILPEIRNYLHTDPREGHQANAYKMSDGKAFLERYLQDDEASS